MAPFIFGKLPFYTIIRTQLIFGALGVLINNPGNQMKENRYDVIYFLKKSLYRQENGM